MQFIYCIMIVLAVTVAIVTALSAVVVLQMKTTSLENPLENNTSLLMNGRRRHHVQNFLDVIHRKSDSLFFRKDFRLNRMIVYRLINLCQQMNLEKKENLQNCLLVTFWFLNNKEPHRTLSNRFDISLLSVFRIIRRVIS
ncbi:hypothetical protein P5V15_008411 [Pogonomyrmex californicus]